MLSCLIKIVFKLLITINSLRMLQHKCQAFYLFENELFSYELKLLNYDGLWENKKLSDENQRFDLIKLIY